MFNGSFSKFDEAINGLGSSVQETGELLPKIKYEGDLWMVN